MPSSDPTQSVADVRRTNVRLPARLHEALKRAAIDRRSTIEEIIQRAVERELTLAGATGPVHLGQDQRRIILAAIGSLEDSIREIRGAVAPENASDQVIRTVALRLFQALPLPVLITTLDGTTRWCNHASEQLFGERLTFLRGKPIASVQRLREKKDIREWESGRSSSVETLDVGGVGKRFLVHRFVFSTPVQACIGSLVFGLDEIEAARKHDVVIPTLPNAELGETASSEIIELVTAFAEHLPTAAMVRDTALNALWCNRQYLILARENDKTEIVGRQLAETFPQIDTTKIRLLDQRVITEGKAILTSLPISESNIRTTLRFPLFDVTGKVFYIAGIGANTEPLDTSPIP